MSDLRSRRESARPGPSDRSHPANRIEAVIFDVDGLMVDSEPLQTLAWDIYLRPFGHRIGSDEKALLLGRRVIESATVLKGHFGLSAEPETIVAGRKPILFSLIRERLRPMPGLFEIVAACARLHLKTAVASSSYSDYVELVLELIGLQARFDVVVTGDQVSAGKPNPEVFLRAAASLGVQPAYCLVLEDSPNGVRAAKSAGMCCAAVNPASAALAELAAADILRADLFQVITDIERWMTRS